MARALDRHRAEAGEASGCEVRGTLQEGSRATLKNLHLSSVFFFFKRTSFMIRYVF